VKGQGVPRGVLCKVTTVTVPYGRRIALDISNRYFIHLQAGRADGGQGERTVWLVKERKHETLTDAHERAMHESMHDEGIHHQVTRDRGTVDHVTIPPSHLSVDSII
jgi:hypothetical protein